MTPADSHRDVHFPEKDQPLRRDVGAMGELVGRVIQEQAGEELFRLVESVRTASIHRREQGKSCEELRALLGGRNPGEVRELVRAFSTYFQVVNLAEQVHRVRRGRDHLSLDGPPQRGSIADAVLRLRGSGLDATAVADLFDGLLIEPVFTAHPTEATRRTILEKQRSIAERLLDRLNPARTPREERTLWARIRTEVTSAWQTQEQPTVRPSVADEREHVLFYLITVLYGVAPALHEVFEEALREAFPDLDPATPSIADQPLVRFASWVGGDMDGNPNVDADSIRAALRRHRHLALSLYTREAYALGRQLSQSSSRVAWSNDIDNAIERYRRILPEVAAELPARDREMGYRALLSLIKARLDRTDEDDPKGFEGPAELIVALRAIESSLAENEGVHAGMFAARRFRRRVETFGFHLATLDIRQDGRVHREVLADLLEDPGWGAKARDDRTAILTELLESGEAARLIPQTDRADRAIEVFRAIQECRRLYGTEAVGPFIISMAEGVDDVLTVLVLATAAGWTEGGGGIPLDVAPLFETVPDLMDGGRTLKALFSNDYYSAHLERRGRRQIVMVGYSDSNKDGGITAARWSLQQAQDEMATAAWEANALLTVFHGRGGTVSRGGGKVHRAVAASPSAALSGRLRLTEQGEVIEAKYGLPSIALRNLERMLGAVALKMSEAGGGAERVNPAWGGIANTLASTSRTAYRALVYDDPNFHSFFRTATPIDVIERMAIGSRPASRRKQAGIEDLRAIPWVFAWTQTRSTLPGWYGLGSGLEAAVEQHGQENVAEALEKWPFLNALVDDVEMVLAKSDMGIAAEYVQLAPQETHGVFDVMRAEFGKAVSWITALKGSTSVLDADVTLQRAIRLRNPYVDPMSLLQVDLLRRWREGGQQDDDLLSALLATVQGIARGLKNTG